MKKTVVGESAVEYDMGEIAVTVASANCCAQDDFIAFSSPQNIPGYNTMDARIPMEAVGQNPQDQQKAAVVHYKSPQQFLVRQDVELSSAVVRVEVLGEPQALFRECLRMVFTGTLTQIPGLEETLGHHWIILSYISYIGCGLSAFFCFICILTYFILRKVRKDPGPAIHSSLAGALLLLNSSFLLNQWASSNAVLCVCVAVAIEAGLLSSFTWMAIEALHLYLLLVKVFNTYVRRYLLKLSLIGWGVPALLVTVSLLVKVGDTPVYGLIEVEDTGYCWITDDVFAYGMNVTFFSLVFIFNFGVLVTVSSRILRRSHNPSTLPGVSCKDLLTVLSMTCLLGTTWGLAFLSMDYTNIPILYLFCILNSLQA
ncbi:adhesion G-protein coupled receptor G6-like [Engraulis encrasicolus]|uniref:adhesion G-protein coupled receptor G6-like n=1 Tax=Engraulis encrasicolus TaxID=184585 RepID=UPI002FD68CAA